MTKSNPANGDRYQWTGREFDDATGLYHYPYRPFDPLTARFLTEDPIGFGAGDTNLGRYAGNDPTNRVDPLGLYEEDPESMEVGAAGPGYVPPGEMMGPLPPWAQDQAPSGGLPWQVPPVFVDQSPEPLRLRRPASTPAASQPTYAANPLLSPEARLAAAREHLTALEAQERAAALALRSKLGQLFPSPHPLGELWIKTNPLVWLMSAGPRPVDWQHPEVVQLLGQLQRVQSHLAQAVAIEHTLAANVPGEFSTATADDYLGSQQKSLAPFHQYPGWELLPTAKRRQLADEFETERSAKVFERFGLEQSHHGCPATGDEGLLLLIPGSCGRSILGALASAGLRKGGHLAEAGFAKLARLRPGAALGPDLEAASVNWAQNINDLVLAQERLAPRLTAEQLATRQRVLANIAESQAARQASSFPANPVFNEIAQFRHELGLPRVAGLGNEPTVSLFEMGGRRFWGSSSANAPQQYQVLMAELARAQRHPQATWQALRHAEADSLIQAFNYGATTNARSGTLFVDRELCSFCSRPGGLDNLLRTIGLKEVRVVTPGNPQGFIIRASPR